MATSEDVRIDAQLLAGVKMDEATTFHILREFIPNLVNEHFRAGKLMTEHFETTERFEVYKPEKELAMVDRMINEWMFQTAEYNVTNEGIMVFHPGKYTVIYFSQPDLPQTQDHPIDLPRPYTAALKFYVAARYRARLFGQNDDSAISFYKEYTNAVETADKFMDRRDSRRKRMPPGRRTV